MIGTKPSTWIEWRIEGIVSHYSFEVRIINCIGINGFAIIFMTMLQRRQLQSQFQHTSVLLTSIFRSNNPILRYEDIAI